MVVTLKNYLNWIPNKAEYKTNGIPSETLAILHIFKARISCLHLFLDIS